MKRHTARTITDDELDALYAALETASLQRTADAILAESQSLEAREKGAAYRLGLMKAYYIALGQRR